MTLFDDEARGFDQAPSGLPDPDMHLDRLSHLLRLAEDWAYKDIPLYVKIDGTDVPINYRYCTTQGVYFAPAVVPLRAVDEIEVPVGHDHPETSRAAARKVSLTYGSHLRVVYDLIAEAGGLTADEVDQRTGWGHSSSSSAVSSLKRAGYVGARCELGTDKPIKRKTRKGNGAEVMFIKRVILEPTHRGMCHPACYDADGHTEGCLYDGDET